MPKNLSEILEQKFSGLKLDILSSLNNQVKTVKELSEELNYHYQSINKGLRELLRIAYVKKLSNGYTALIEFKRVNRNLKGFYPIDPKLKLKPHYLVNKKGEILNKKTGKILKTYKNTRGYLITSFTTVGNLTKKYTVHKIVATTFLKKMSSSLCVNHKDGNKLNNNVNNLEWITSSENNKHAYDTGLKTPYSKAIVQKTLEGRLIKQYKSITQASQETGFKQAGICKACKGQQTHHKGFKWEYVI